MIEVVLTMVLVGIVDTAVLWLCFKPVTERYPRR